MALAQLASSRCKASKETIALSLEGTWDEDQLFMLRQSKELYDFYQKKIFECDEKIKDIISKYADIVNEDTTGIKNALNALEGGKHG